MIIAISGTPGTGKTEVSKALAKKLNARSLRERGGRPLNANLIGITPLVISHKLGTWDSKRKTLAVDVSELKKCVRHHTIKNSTNIIEGHMAHMLPSDFVFILRCNPVVLMKRLQKLGWNRAKIRENVEAELTGTIMAEASQHAARAHSPASAGGVHSWARRFPHARCVYEIDTTKARPEAVALIMERILKRPSDKKHAAGKINWLTGSNIKRLAPLLR
ncbi:adenylate kinase family protein [Candidatus Micrarchaeota archaeon]|nr:adenylate kinase family protein [Candidatus Micrarchaeota archaeon]